jgi:hypothetical protein
MPLIRMAFNPSPYRSFVGVPPNRHARFEARRGKTHKTTHHRGASNPSACVAISVSCRLTGRDRRPRAYSGGQRPRRLLTTWWWTRGHACHAGERTLAVSGGRGWRDSSRRVRAVTLSDRATSFGEVAGVRPVAPLPSPQRPWTGSRRRHLLASQMSVQEPGNSPSYCSPMGLRSIRWSLMSGCSPYSDATIRRLDAIIRVPRAYGRRRGPGRGVGR